MSEYIKYIEKIFLFSEKKVLVFKNKEDIIWNSKKAENLVKNGVEYSDLKIRVLETDDGLCFGNVEVRKNSEVFRGEYSETKEDNVLYSLVVLETDDIIIRAFSDNDFLGYMQYHDSLISLSLTQISSYADILKETVKQNGNTDNTEELCDKINMNCIRIMKTVRDNNHLIEAINKNDFSDDIIDVKSLLQKIAAKVSSVLDCRISAEFSDTEKIYIICSEKDFFILILSALRYAAVCSGTSELKINLTEISEKYFCIMIESFGKAESSNSVKSNLFISFDTEKFLINKMSQKLSAETEIISDSECTKIKLCFRKADKIPPVFRMPDPFDDSGRFSMTRVMFYDFLDNDIF